MNRLFCLFFLFIIFGIGACAPTLVKPDLTLQEVELTGISFSSMDLAFIIKVTNPNSVGVQIEKLTYQLDLNDVSLGSGALSEPVSIKGSASQLVTLPFSTSINGLSQLLRMILGENEVNYKLKGKVVLSKFWAKQEFPFENKGIVPLNRSTFHH